MYKRNTDARSRNHGCCGTAESITYSEWMCVTFVIQHAKHKRPIVLLSVVLLDVPYFSTLLHTRHDFRGGGVILHEVCALNLSTTII